MVRSAACGASRTMRPRCGPPASFETRCFATLLRTSRSETDSIVKTSQALRCSRADFPPEFSVRVLRCALPQKRGARLGSPQERKRSAVRRMIIRCPYGEHAPARRSRFRLTALHCGVLLPSGPRRPASPLAGSKRKEESIRGSVLSRGAIVQGLPGAGLRVVRAGADPRSRSASPAERSSGEREARKQI